jgi:hypothetical protein
MEVGDYMSFSRRLVRILLRLWVAIFVLVAAVMSIATVYSHENYGNHDSAGVIDHFMVEWHFEWATFLGFAGVFATAPVVTLALLSMIGRIVYVYAFSRISRPSVNAYAAG